MTRALLALAAAGVTVLSACGSGADGPTGGQRTSARTSGDSTAPSGGTPATTPSPASSSASAASQSTTSAATGGGSFRGIIQFDGTPQTGNPSIRGGMIIVAWSDIEPSPGSFDWAHIDPVIAQWAAAGKQAAIRVQTFWPNHAGFPSWLPSQGARLITDADGNQAPVFWDTHYLAALQTMVTALAARYDGDPRVLWVQAGVGLYGETKVDRMHDDPSHDPPQVRQVWYDAGYTDPVWWSTIQQVVGMYLGAFHRTSLVVAVEPGFMAGTAGYTEPLITAWLADHGVWWQHDGLRSTTHFDDPSLSRTPHIEEQYLSTAKTGDSLSQELQVAIGMGSRYVLLYGSDVTDPRHQGDLAAAARQAS